MTTLKFLWRLPFLTFVALVLCLVMVGQLQGQEVKRGCDCAPTGICECGAACTCGLISVQDKKDARAPIRVTCKSGYVVTFVWNDKLGFHVPNEPGWTYSYEKEVWMPPTPQMPYCPDEYQYVPNQGCQPMAGFGGFQGQFQGFGGGCANGQCSGTSGGFSRRR